MGGSLEARSFQATVSYDCAKKNKLSFYLSFVWDLFGLVLFTIPCFHRFDFSEVNPLSEALMKALISQSAPKTNENKKGSEYRGPWEL